MLNDDTPICLLSYNVSSLSFVLAGLLMYKRLNPPLLFLATATLETQKTGSRSFSTQVNFKNNQSRPTHTDSSIHFLTVYLSTIV